MRRSQTVEQVTHPTITPMNLENLEKSPVLIVKTEYMIPATKNRELAPWSARGRNGQRTELKNGQDHDDSEQNVVRGENLYPPREKYLNAACNQCLVVIRWVSHHFCIQNRCNQENSSVV